MKKSLLLISTLFAAGTLSSWAETYTIETVEGATTQLSIAADPTSPWTSSIIQNYWGNTSYNVTITKESDKSTVSQVTTTAADTIVFASSVSGFIGAWGSGNADVSTIAATYGNIVINENVTFTINSGGSDCVPWFTGSLSGKGHITWGNADASNKGDYLFSGDITAFEGNFTRANAVYTADTAVSYADKSFGILQFGAYTAAAYVVTAKNVTTDTEGVKTISKISGSGDISTASVLKYNYTTSSDYDYLSVDNHSISARHIIFDGGANYIVNTALTGYNSTAANNTLEILAGTVKINGAVSNFGNGSVAANAELELAGTTSISTLTNAGTLKITNAAFTGDISNSNSATFTGATVTGSVANSGTATFAGTTSVTTLTNYISTTDATSGETTTTAGTVNVTGATTVGTLDAGAGTISVTGTDSSSASLTVSSSLTSAGTISVNEYASLDLTGSTVTLASTIANTGTVIVSSGTKFELSNFVEVDTNTTPGARTYELITSGSTVTGWNKETLTRDNFLNGGLTLSTRKSIDVSTAGVVVVTGNLWNMTWAGGTSGTWVADTDATATNVWDGVDSGDSSQTATGTYFVTDDNAIFETANATVTISGKVEASKITVKADTTFSPSENNALHAREVSVENGANMSINTQVYFTWGTANVASDSTITFVSPGSAISKNITGTGTVVVDTSTYIDIDIGDEFAGTVKTTGNFQITNTNIGTGTLEVYGNLQCAANTSKTFANDVTFIGGTSEATTITHQLHTNSTGGASSVTFSGNVTIEQYSILNKHVSSGAISFNGGDLTINGGLGWGTNAGGTISIVVAENKKFTVGEKATVNNASTLTMSGANGTTTLGNSSSTTFSGAVLLSGSGASLTVGADGWATGDTATTFKAASLTLSGTGTNVTFKNGSTTTFTGDISTTATDNYARNITIDEGATVTAANFTNSYGMGTLTVNGELTVTGTLKFATANNNSTATNKITGTGTITTNALSIGHSGKYNFDGVTLKIGDGGIVYGGTATSYTLSLGAMTVVATGDTSWSTTQTSGSSTTDVNITFAAASGSATEFEVTNKDTTVTLGSTTGAGALKKTGEGTLVITSANTLTGSVTVDAGTLEIKNSYASKAIDSFTVNGGELKFNGSLENSQFGAITLNGGKISFYNSSYTTNKNMLASGATVKVTKDAEYYIDTDASSRIVAKDYGAITFTISNDSTLEKTGSGSLYMASTTMSGSGTFKFTGGGEWVMASGNGSTVKSDSYNTLAIEISDSSMCLAGTTFNAGQFTLTNGAVYNGTLVLNKDSSIGATSSDTMILGKNGDQNATNVTVAKGVTLTLGNGLTYGSIGGEGKVVLKEDSKLVYGISSSFKTELTAAEVVLESGTELQFRTFADYTLSVDNLTVNGKISHDDSTGTAGTVAKVSVGTDQTIGGTGTIELATTLSSNATLNVREGKLTFSGGVTFADDATVLIDSTMQLADNVALQVICASAITFGDTAGTTYTSADVTAGTLDITSVARDYFAETYADYYWLLSTSGSNLVLTMSSIPEPSMFGLLAGTLALALAGTRRRRRGNVK